MLGCFFKLVCFDKHCYTCCSYVCGLHIVREGLQEIVALDNKMGKRQSTSSLAKERVGEARAKAKTVEMVLSQVGLREFDHEKMSEHFKELKDIYEIDVPASFKVSLYKQESCFNMKQRRVTDLQAQLSTGLSFASQDVKIKLNGLCWEIGFTKLIQSFVGRPTTLSADRKLLDTIDQIASMAAHPANAIRVVITFSRKSSSMNHCLTT